MCRFISGIILKDKIKLAEDGDQSHSNLLEKMGLNDDYIGASKTFVRAELVPIENQWWIDPQEYPESWEFCVDQDIVPEWFDLEREKYEKDFREMVYYWWKVHVLIGEEVRKLDSGYYLLKDCQVEKLAGNVCVELFNSNVDMVMDHVIVDRMRGRSVINRMKGCSCVYGMDNTSNISIMYDNTIVGAMFSRAKIFEMKGSSAVRYMRE